MLTNCYHYYFISEKCEQHAFVNKEKIVPIFTLLLNYSNLPTQFPINKLPLMQVLFQISKCTREKLLSLTISVKNNRATYIAIFSCSYPFPGWATVHGVTNSQTCLSDLKKKREKKTNSPHHHLFINRQTKLVLEHSLQKEKKKNHLQTL